MIIAYLISSTFLITKLALPHKTAEKKIDSHLSFN